MDQTINGWFNSGIGNLKSSLINDLFKQSEVRTIKYRELLLHFIYLVI